MIYLLQVFVWAWLSLSSSFQIYFHILKKKKKKLFLEFVQLFSHVQLFVTPWTVACQSSLYFIISRTLLKFMSIESVMPSNHIIPSCPLFLLQSFPASGSFPMSQLRASGGQSTGASASASVLFLMFHWVLFFSKLSHGNNVIISVRSAS